MAIINLTESRQVTSQKRPEEPSRKWIRPRRRVRFDECRNRSYAAHKDRTAEDCRETWYSTHEYKQIRANFKASIRNLKQRQEKQQESGTLSFSDIHQDLLGVVASVDHVVEDPGQMLNTKVQQMLSLLYHNNSSDNDDGSLSFELIGLELYLDCRAKWDAQQRRDAILDVVYDVQNEFNAGLFLNSDDSDDDDLTRNTQAYEAELQDSCLNFSQASSLLAHFKAQARLLIITA